MDTLKVKLIDLNMGLVDGAKHIVRTEGVTGYVNETKRC